MRIELRSRTRSLLIEWCDGISTNYSHLTLRTQCRCAGCVRIRRGGRSVEVPEDVELLAIVPYGPNAVQLRFSDGHERGIFPFPYLRELERSAPSV